MFLILLVYIAALSLEAFGSYLSVIGLASKTGPILVILIITLDFSKIMIASVLYKRWHEIHWVLSVILVPVVMSLVIVTSTGTYGYLIKEFNKTNISTEQQRAKINILEKEKEKLEVRKQAIDIQISQLPSNSVNQRRRLTDLFSKESNYINSRLLELNNELPDLKIKSLQTNSDAGTLAGIAEAYNMTTVQINKIVALFIVFFVDPLAIVLLTLANFLSSCHKKELNIKNEDNERKKIKITTLLKESRMTLIPKMFLTKQVNSNANFITKTKQDIKTVSFISNVDLQEEKIKLLEKQSIYLPSSDIMKPIVEVTKKNNTELLKTSDMIKQIEICDSQIEVNFKKTIGVILKVNNFLEDIQEKNMSKELLLLQSEDMVSNIKETEKIEVVNSSESEIIENTEEEIGQNDNKIFLKPTPQSVAVYNDTNKNGGFFENENENLIHYIPLNCSEDNSGNINEEMVSWNDDLGVETPLRKVLPIKSKI
jgi:phage shock protein PspC (stress-responsive transcriptional regulator)